MVTAKYVARFKDDNLVFLSLSPGVVNSQPDMGELTPFLGFLFYFIWVLMKRMFADLYFGIQLPMNPSVLTLQCFNPVTLIGMARFSLRRNRWQRCWTLFPSWLPRTLAHFCRTMEIPRIGYEYCGDYSCTTFSWSLPPAVTLVGVVTRDNMHQDQRCLVQPFIAVPSQLCCRKGSGIANKAREREKKYSIVRRHKPHKNTTMVSCGNYYYLVTSRQWSTEDIGQWGKVYLLRGPRTAVLICLCTRQRSVR